METAPKDGSKFWGCVDDDAISMFWHPDFGEFISSFRRMTLRSDLTFDDTGKNFKDHSPEVHKPTAWMPIIQSNGDRAPK